MANMWMPGAKRFDTGDHGKMDGGPKKAVAHITWDVNASSSAPKPLLPFSRLESYFTGGGASAAPHILLNPFTGQATQFLPADSRSKSLRDLPGGTRINRDGTYVIQIEFLFFPNCVVDGKAYATLADTPMKGWKELVAWTESLGIPSRWPMGKPNFKSSRSVEVWRKEGGWYGHSQVPENDHTDPGPIKDFPSITPVPNPSPVYAPFPGATFFRLGKKHPIITAMGKRLVAEGYRGYAQGPGPEFTRADIKAYSWWQRKLGYSGAAADGYPGEASWKALKVPKA